MGRIIEVRLEDIVPTEAWVYRDDLRRTASNWDQVKFDNGSWLEVFPVLNFYFLPDGTHRAYHAHFVLGYETAKIRLATAEDYPNPDNEFKGKTEWEAYQIVNFRASQEVFSQGVTRLKELKDRIKEGNWRTQAKLELKEILKN